MTALAAMTPSIVDAWFDEQFADVAVMVILRGFAPERTVELAGIAWDAGVRLVEVPVQDAESLRALGAVVDAADGRPVGAGTVTDPELVLTGTAPLGLEGCTGIAALLPRDSVHVLPEFAVATTALPVAARGTVQRMIFTGSVFEFHVKVGNALEIRLASSPEEVAALGAEQLGAGRKVQLAWRPEAVVILEDS